MSRAIGKLVIHHRSDGVAMGTLDAFFMMRCIGAVSPADVLATLKCGEIVKACRPQGSATIVAVDPTSTFPSEETRRVAREATRQTNVQTSALVVILLGDGFWASAIRGVLITLTSLSPTEQARKIVRQEAEGIDWIVDIIGESPQKYRSALLLALAELKSGALPSKSKPPVAPSKLPPSSKRQAE